MLAELPSASLFCFVCFFVFVLFFFVFFCFWSSSPHTSFLLFILFFFFFKLKKKKISIVMVFFSPSFTLLENILFSFFLLYFSIFPIFFFFFFHYYFIILVFNSVASLGVGQSAGDLARWSLVWPVPPFFCWWFCCFTFLPSFSPDLFSLHRLGLFHSIIPVKFLCSLFLVWLGVSHFHSFFYFPLLK